LRNPSATGSSGANEAASVCSCVRVHAPRLERDFHIVPGVLCGFFDRHPRSRQEHDQVGKRDLFPARLRNVEVPLDRFERLKDLRKLNRAG